MKKNRWMLRAAGLLLTAMVLNTTVSLAAEVGSSGDPLVTLSYLNSTFLTQVLEKVDSKLATRNTALSNTLSAQITAFQKDIAEKYGTSSGSDTGGTAATFTVVTLTKGKVLTGEVGCEVMLRVGSASCVAPSSPGLIDETSGGSIAGGTALTANHLYMMTVEGRGVKATAATTKLLVRGTYTVA